MTKISYTVINAFVPSDKDAASSGNPAAVFILPGPSSKPTLPLSADQIKTLYPSDGAMHKIAIELDLPMCSFLVPLGGSEYAIRWFCSEGEAPMCGHGTVAAASHMFANGLAEGKVNLYCPRALLSAEQTENGVAIQLPVFHPAEPASAEVVEVLKNGLGDGTIPINLSQVSYWRVLEYDSSVDLGAVKVDHAILAKLRPAKFGLFQIAPSTNDNSAGPNLRTRVFTTSPDGYVEDDATGSAHGAMVPLALSTRLDALRSAHPSLPKDGEVNTLKIRQASPRGGQMVATWLRKEGQVRLEARTAAVSTSEIEIDA